MKREESYYTKKKVYGDNPLKEVIYELEDAVQHDPFLELSYVPKDVLWTLLDRHANTVKEFKRRLANLIN